MEEKIILYQARIDRFSRRLVKVFFPHVVIPLLCLFLPFLSTNFYNFFTAVWLLMMLSIMLMMLVSAYKWTFNQIALLTFHDDLFEIEIISNNTRHVHTIDKDNIKTILKWQGGRPRILKLSLFDNDYKITDLYSGGKQTYV
ncbi:MAG: hypothetical protein ABIU77_24640, partial [Ferruginibacter sp.]